jgi:nucleobase:cation symporter-1, NCS1 family
MIPFFNVGTLYEGPAANALGGADISFFVGLPVAGLLYYAFTRSIDAAPESRIAEAEAAQLEQAAEQHKPLTGSTHPHRESEATRVSCTPRYVCLWAG